jgi:hypothetical protein
VTLKTKNGPYHVVWLDAKQALDATLGEVNSNCRWFVVQYYGVGMDDFDIIADGFTTEHEATQAAYRLTLQDATLIEGRAN